MLRAADTAFGTCGCGTSYTGRTITVNMTVRDQELSLSDVPQGFCPGCGSRVYLAAHLELLEAVMHNRAVETRV